ncbi:acyltransferase family protein [Angustibacter sp. McL0619]|uniref:acyltransferase family protein n=1 Tax=Angustibacter sp. McL0619 TaxID=3415676 RepID=UPI003CEDB466
MTDLRTVPAPGAAARDVQEDRKGEGFRPDVEGLRTIAIGTVLLYHAGISYVPGGFVGVDVFFVISGFLITGLLLRELRRSGTISLTRFYARRAKRLLPATAVVLAGTALMTIAFLPRISWRSIGGDIMAAAAYVVNWRLAAGSVNYLNEDQAVSPVQQFWSLAVEEQYYLVWPLLLLLAALWFRRRRAGQVTNGPLWVGLAVIAIPSFIWSVYETAHNPSVAFFVTTTRMWELAVGAAVAIAATSLARLPSRVAAVSGWAGLALIGVSALVIHTSYPWPGALALLPTVGTALVIACGPASGRAGPVALLGTTPFVWVGGLSYSLYLWHWPIVVVATEHWGGRLTVAQGVFVIALSFVPAYLSLRLVENPFRYMPRLSRQPRTALAVGAAFTAVGILVGFGLRAAVPEVGVKPGTAKAATAIGAEALGDHPRTSPAGIAVDRVDWMTPGPLQAADDVPVAYADDCQQTFAGTAPKMCEYGDKNSDRTVALVGDSKALQWLPALQAIAGQEHWRIVTYTKSDCAFTDALVTSDDGVYDQCRTWNRKVQQALAAHPADVVVTSSGKRVALLPGSRTNRSVEAMAGGLQRAWRRVAAAGSQVVVIRDNPAPAGVDMDECVAENPNQLTRCTFDRTDGLRVSGGTPQLMAAPKVPEARLLDLTDAICPRQACAPVIGHVLVFRQGSHLTATYVASLASRLHGPLVDAMTASTAG